MIFFVGTTTSIQVHLTQPVEVFKHQSAEYRASTSNKILYTRTIDTEKRGESGGSLWISPFRLL
jgi:hypothetical protein